MSDKETNFDAPQSLFVMGSADVWRLGQRRRSQYFASVLHAIFARIKRRHLRASSSRQLIGQPEKSKSLRNQENHTPKCAWDHSQHWRASGMSSVPPIATPDTDLRKSTLCAVSSVTDRTSNADRIDER